MTTERPARVRVTAPATGRPRRTTVLAEIDEGTGVGEAYMRSLLKSQLRLAVSMTALLTATIGALPLAFVASGWLRHGRLAGVPVAWLILGAGCYPVLLVIAWAYVRISERNERDFRDLVERHQ